MTGALLFFGLLRLACLGEASGYCLLLAVACFLHLSDVLAYDFF